MKNHIDVGNAGIYGSAIGGVGTTGMTVAEWITVNATIIGLSLSLLSLLVGICFKMWDSHRNRKDEERRHKESLQLQAAEEVKTREALIQEMRRLAGKDD